MKTRKRWMASLLALVLTLVMTVPIFAEDSKGTITINKTVKDQTYTIYRIFDLESYDAEQKAYLYKVNDDWKNFVEQDEIKAYVTVDSVTGLVTWKKKDGEGNPVGAAEFAKKALAYAKKNKINFVSQQKANGATVVFSNLELGYYLVDSSLGALCVLNTTNPDVKIDEKNGTPTVEKKVMEGSNFMEEGTAHRLGTR